jgi:hypothetical protein
MAFSDRNLGDREALMRVAAGFAGMILGLFIMIVVPMGMVVSAVGLIAVAEGYYRWSFLRALKSR